MKTFVTLATATALISGLSGLALAQAPDRQILLDVDYAPRQVVQVEIGDFHFRPGQLGPLHTHTAPVIGYVSKGTIYYQVEGMPAQILKPGDAFYEPAGLKILHFDNASPTEEAIFTDFNLERKGDPFIVFDHPPTEAIDRRAFPTAKFSAVTSTKAQAYAEAIAAGKSLTLTDARPLFGYVAEGSVNLKLSGNAVQRIEQGKSFYVPASATATLTPVGVRAKVISFYIR